MRRLALTLMLTMVALASGADAQSLNPGPPGPFVFDFRGATSNMPSDVALFPGLSTGATVPTRGFGGSVGGHFYPFQMGPGRLGVGVDALMVRGPIRASAGLIHRTVIETC